MASSGPDRRGGSTSDIASISIEEDKAQPPPVAVQRQRSIRFPEQPESNLAKQRIPDVRKMSSSSAEVSPRRRLHPQHGSDDESPDAEYQPIAASGSGRNYNTSSSPQTDSNPKTDNKSNTAARDQNRSSSSSEEDLPWYRRIAEKYGTIELDNKGSVARDHLALERTFLAWLRTSLSFASIGIAITQLFRLNTTIAKETKRSESATFEQQQAGVGTDHLTDQSILNLLTNPQAQAAIPAKTAQHLRHLGKPLGATFLGVAILVLLIGFHRYFESQHWIIRGKFPASRVSVAAVGLMTAALVVGSMIVVLVVSGGTVES